jgi:hypothetical protein
VIQPASEYKHIVYGYGQVDELDPGKRRSRDDYGGESSSGFRQ